MNWHILAAKWMDALNRKGQHVSFVAYNTGVAAVKSCRRHCR